MTTLYDVLAPIWIPAGAKPNSSGRPTEEFHCQWRIIAQVRALTAEDALARAKRQHFPAPIIQPSTQAKETLQ